MFVKQLSRFLTYRPQYRFFFFDNKKQKEIQQLKDRIDELKNNYYESEETQDQQRYLQEVILIHDQINSDQKGICVEQLLDKLELANLYIENGNENDPLFDEILTLDLKDIHFKNVNLDSHPKGYKEYQLNEIKRSLYSIKLGFAFDDEESDVLLQWVEDFKTATEFVYEYQMKYFDVIEEVLYDRRIVKGTYYAYLTAYHEYRSKIFLDENKIGEAIEQLEHGLRNCEQAIHQQKSAKTDQDQEVAYIAAADHEKSVQKMGELFRELAEIQVDSGELSDSRVYFEKALELFLHTIGKQNVLYVSTYCSYAQTYFDNDLNKCNSVIEELYYQLEDSTAKEPLLYISLFYFCLQMNLNNHPQVVYDKIMNLLEEQEIYIENPSLLYDFHFLAAEYQNNNNNKKVCIEHLEEAIAFIEEFGDVKRADKTLSVIDRLVRYQCDPDSTDIQLAQCLELLEDSEYRYENHEDDQEQDQHLLFLVEYYIAYLHLRLKSSFQFSINEAVSPFISFMSLYKHNDDLANLLATHIWEYSHTLHQNGYPEIAIEILEQGIKILKTKSEPALVKELQIFTNQRDQWQTNP